MENKCLICPRNCGIDRSLRKGVCKVNNEFIIARAEKHFWEEPCISGENGSGTIFFSGCNLGCIFCQNKEISAYAKGKTVSSARLKEIFFELKEKGAHNVNLVTPSHYTLLLAEILPSSPLPVVWNSSAYEKAETLARLDGLVQVYLPDFKFGSSECAKKYASAPDYPEIAKNAIKEMFRQRGKYKIENGMLTSGVLIRHLVLPENLENTYKVIDWVAENFAPDEVLFSLMSQYTPIGNLPFEELNRPINKKEYILARNYMLKKGIKNGFVQELSSAKQEYTPPFDLSGV